MIRVWRGRRRSYFAALAFFYALPASADPTGAAAGAEAPAPAVRTPVVAARAALTQLLARAESTAARAGGSVALAARQDEFAHAETVNAWLAWLPEFSLAIRRQFEQQTSGPADAPRWRIDIEGQAAFSLRKFAAASVAGAARAKTQAEVAEGRHLARQAALFQVFELYLAERRALALEDQLADFEHLASSIPGENPAQPSGDALLLNGRLGELRASLAAIERQRREAAARLATTLDLPVESSGIDVRLDAPELFDLIRSASLASPSKEDEVLRAGVTLEQRRLRLAQAQRFYAPELRVNGVAQLPKTRAGTASEEAFRLAGITAEFSLGFRLRPGAPSRERAAQRAVARSRFESVKARWARQQVAEQARASRDALLALWNDVRGLPAARATYDDVAQRFTRGERTVADLAVASRRLLDAELERDDLLQQVLTAQIVLSSHETDSNLAQSQAGKQLSFEQANERFLRAAESTASVKAALAEAQRARLQAQGESSALATSLDAGVSVPFYENEALYLESQPLLGFAGTSALSTPVREVSALGRWSIDLRGVGAQARALQYEARLRGVQAEAARKRFLWEALRARLEAAHARAQLAVAERLAELAGRHVTLEQTWFQQGAARAEDVRGAELAYRSARLARGRAEARKRAAEALVATYLGAPRETALAVDETAEALEDWARRRLIPDHGLTGFQAELERRAAELEAQYARAQAEALARPPRATTFTAQAIQGLRGGAFSLTVALSVALDPPRDAPRVARAAAQEGAARGRVSTLERELAARRAQVTAELARANRELETEKAVASELARIEAPLSTGSFAAADVHEALKQRGRVALETAQLESEQRRLAAEERRRVATLNALAVGERVAPAFAQQLVAPSLAGTLDSLRETGPDVVVADAAAHDVEARGRSVPVLSALHLVGPFTVGSYSVSRVTGPSTTKVLQADQGVGLSLALDESLSFATLAQLRSSAVLEQKAARRHAERRAVREVARAWTAREIERLSRAEETAASRYLEDSVLPRFSLGQVTPALLADAQAARTRARVQHGADVAAESALRATLQARGVPLDDAVLDDFQRRAGALAEPKRTSQRRVDPGELAARARSAAASHDVAASGLRLVSPVTGLFEFRPAHLETTRGTAELRHTTTDRELLWVGSVLVPLRLQALGRLPLDLARARLSDEEVAQASLRARDEQLSVSRQVSHARAFQAAARAQREASERAFSEVERRFRNQERHTSIDEVVRARHALFEAQRAEAVATGAALEAHWALGIEEAP